MTTPNVRACHEHGDGYNGYVFTTDEGLEFHVCLRDFGLEVTVQGVERDGPVRWVSIQPDHVMVSGGEVEQIG